jgi:hypothetical protein
VDVASGNSYLGFILYELFLKDDSKGKILSIEPRPELYAQSQERAQKLSYQRMEFQCKSIQEAVFPERVHLMTALHACDMATDDALVQGIRRKWDYLFLVPCCQAEVAQLLKSEKSNQDTSRLLYAYPHHRREFAAHLTNVLRVLALKSFGYKVQVTELTSWEHTAKGELILAKRIQAYDRQAKDDLFGLLDHFGIQPQFIGELFPEMIQ